MSFVDNILQVLRLPLDFVRDKVSAVRSAEARAMSDGQRMRNLPAEFKGEYEANRQLAREYKQRGVDAKNVARDRLTKRKGNVGNGQMPMPVADKGAKKKMGLFSKKKRCPGCGEKLDARWELCPYCGFGAPDAGGGGGSAPGGHPRTQALDAVNYGGGGGGGGGKPRTMALDMGAAPGGAGAAASRLVGWIIPLDGPQGGQLLELRARAIVGTAPDCDVVVKDSSISGRHAEFTAQGGAFRVSDLGSTNGTYVNDKRVQTAELVDGDTLRLGRTPFKFKST